MIIILCKNKISVGARLLLYTSKIDRFFYMKQIKTIGKQIGIVKTNNEIKKNLSEQNKHLKFIIKKI